MRDLGTYCHQKLAFDMVMGFDGKELSGVPHTKKLSWLLPLKNNATKCITALTLT